MTDSDPLKEAFQLLQRISELTPTEQDGEVDRAEPPVREAARALLNQLRSPHNFLEGAVVEGAEGLLESPDGPELSGTTIDGFRLERRIGRGAMGSVYLASQESPSRRVAIKMLRFDYADPGARRRFRQESEALARMQHPSVAQVISAGSHTVHGLEVPYIAMEYVEEAETLTDFCEALDLNRRLQLLCRVCDAVHHGHLRRVVHRDLKPQNILVGPDGVPKIVDFGIAQIRDLDGPGASIHTLAGSILGTPMYMSPEQCRGETEAIDARSDVYSLGVIAYQVVSGALPYGEENLKHLGWLSVVPTAEPRPLTVAGRRAPPKLEQILHKALQKQPGDRYESAADFAADLRAFVTGDPVTVSPPSPWQSMTRWMMRHPATSLALYALAITVLVGSGALATWQYVTSRPSHIMRIGNEKVRLMGISGNALFEWSPGGPKPIDHAVVAHGAEGRSYTAIAYDLQSEVHPGQICVYDWDEPGNAVWASDVSAWPVELTIQEKDGFIVPAMVAADCFSEYPGDELIVVHRLYPQEHSAIRIYNLTGTVLYETWHFGAISSVIWHEHSRQIVVGAVTNERDYYRRHGWDSSFYPAVIFAIRPRLGHARVTNCVNDGVVRDPSITWYRWIGPADQACQYNFQPPAIESPRPTDPATFTAVAQIRRSDDPPHPLLFLTVSDSGKELSRFPDSHYLAAVENLGFPEPGAFRVLEYAEKPDPDPVAD